MNKKITCVSRCLLSDPAGRILLLKRRKESTWGAAQWQLPGGKISWGETPRQAAMRETLEETGLTPIGITLLDADANRVRIGQDDYHVVEFVYAGRFAGKPTLSEEHCGYRITCPKNALKLDLTRDTRKMIARLLRARK